jgi:hypothetical protein
MMMSVRTVVVVALAGLSVSGCQTINSFTGLGGDTPVAPTPAPAIVPAEPAPVPSAPIAKAPLSLKGMDGAAVMSLWGEPALRRKDIGSELWTYNKGGAKCSVLLYLYPSGDGRMTVKRSEAVPGGADESAVDACAKTNNLASLKPVS